MHTVREIQARLADLGYLAAIAPDGTTNIDGQFGQRTLDAYNHYRATLGKPPVTIAPELEVEADLWPDEQPPLVQTTSNPFDNPLVKIGLELLLPSILKGIPMGNIFKVLSGAKTYIAGTAMMLTGIADFAQPGIVPGSGSFTPLAWVLGGLVVIGARNALATSLVSILEKLTGTDPANLPK